ncbi:dTMP kinase [Cystobacter fuscus]
MFIDFEGIDGSGKTTLSNLLAARLSRLGYKVAHAREGGELRSPVARRIRELTRDASLLEMSPRTEFFLNLARDAQQLEEVIAPALARGEVCISDRYLYSQLALTGGGRGLELESLRAPCELASRGLWPDLVILVDVEPELARLRKRLGKSKGERALDNDSRKGRPARGSPCACASLPGDGAPGALALARHREQRLAPARAGATPGGRGGGATGGPGASVPRPAPAPEPPRRPRCQARSTRWRSTSSG